MSRAHSKQRSSVPIIAYTLFPSPIGKMGIAATPRGLCRLSLNVPGESSFRKRMVTQYHGRAIRRDEKFIGLAAELRAYFSGRPIEFKSRLDLQQGTPFQRKVYQALRRIPYGQTRSYRAVARKIGRPKCSRAVGGACGRNPLPLLIPCHRVMNANGQPGGFSGGLRIKQFLLALETGP